MPPSVETELTHALQVMSQHRESTLIENACQQAEHLAGLFADVLRPAQLEHLYPPFGEESDADAFVPLARLAWHFTEHYSDELAINLLIATTVHPRSPAAAYVTILGDLYHEFLAGASAIS